MNLKKCVNCKYAQVEDDNVKCLLCRTTAYPKACKRQKWIEDRMPLEKRKVKAMVMNALDKHNARSIVNNGLTTSEISELVGVSTERVRSALKELQMKDRIVDCFHPWDDSYGLWLIVI
jgi:hypothetical protein